MIDITKTNSLPNGIAFLDAHNGTFDDQSSRAHNFGGGFAGYGLVTGISFQPAAVVPEPGTLTLLGLGLVAVGGYVRIKKPRPQKRPMRLG